MGKASGTKSGAMPLAAAWALHNAEQEAQGGRVIRWWKVTVIRFEIFLARQATIDDLDEDLFAKFREWQGQNGYSRATAASGIGRLRFLRSWVARKRLAGGLEGGAR
jgi:hypothetical protein